MASFKDRVENTETYKGLNSVQRIITVKKQNRLALERGYIKAKTLGLEKFDQLTEFSNINNRIIKDLVQNED